MLVAPVQGASAFSPTRVLKTVLKILHRLYRNDGYHRHRISTSQSAQVPFHARKIEALLASLMLFKMQNVAVVLKDEIGNRGVETFLIGTLNEQDRRILQDALSEGTSQCN